MKICIVDVGPQSRIERCDAGVVVAYDVAFTSSMFTGNATLQARRTGDLADENLQRFRYGLVGAALEVSIAALSLRDFKVLHGPGVDHVAPLGPRGAFSFCGRITAHLNSGEGSVFEAGDAAMVIGVRSLPPDSLEVAPGSWVSFLAFGLSFWLI